MEKKKGSSDEQLAAFICCWLWGSFMDWQRFQSEHTLMRSIHCNHTHKSGWVRPTECVCTSLGMQRCPQWCRGSAAVLPCFKGAEDLYLMRSEQTGARGWSQIESWRRGLTNTTIVITQPANPGEAREKLVTYWLKLGWRPVGHACLSQCDTDSHSQQQPDGNKRSATDL